MSWDMTASLIRECSLTSLARLGRHPSAIREYRRFKAENVLTRYASVTDYLYTSVFGLECEAGDGEGFIFRGVRRWRRGGPCITFSQAFRSPYRRWEASSGSSDGFYRERAPSVANKRESRRAAPPVAPPSHPPSPPAPAGLSLLL